MKIKNFVLDYISPIAFIVLISIGSTVAYNSIKKEGKKLGSATVSNTLNLTASSTNYASTSPKYIYYGESISYPMFLGTSTLTHQSNPYEKIIEIGNDTDEFCQNMWWTASSTDSDLRWQYSFSQDGTNFYFEDDNPAVSSGTYTHGVTTTTHLWIVATAGATKFKEDCVSTQGQKFLKINYYYLANGGRLYSEGFFKSDY